MAEWKFGTVLERRGEKVLFLRNEVVERGFSSYLKFHGMRLTQGTDTPRSNKPGAVGLYTTQGWKVVEEIEPELSPYAAAVRNSGGFAIPSSLFSGRVRGSGGEIYDPENTITGTAGTIEEMMRKYLEPAADDS